MDKYKIHITLAGNPNSGKTSIFNSLTGLNQKVGNFPGVTVEKKVGVTTIEGKETLVTDIPGSYSLYPRRVDEAVAYNAVLNQYGNLQTDVFLVVVDASSLKRNLLYCTQIIDLKKPIVVALTMVDLAQKKGIRVDVAALERELGVPIVIVNPRKHKGINELKKAIHLVAGNLYKPPVHDFIDIDQFAPNALAEIKKLFPTDSNYHLIHILTSYKAFNLDDATKEQISTINKSTGFSAAKFQGDEILHRYKKINQILHNAVSFPDPLKRNIISEKIDDVLLHRFWGYIILLAVFYLLFQSVFLLASYPMDMIETGTASVSSWLLNVLPDNNFTDLLVNGLIAGLGGIIIFIPQIMILFGLITLLEDTGYMARISFLSDKLMRKVGLNGKSVMPMISGFACAVPAIMSARSIENKKERLLTILVTPLMSCSARLPVYIILIGLVIPEKYYLGFVGLQGLVMMGLYLLGTVTSLIISYIAKFFIKSNEKSYFILELPLYRAPRWKNAFITMVAKAKIFVLEAGKVILIISLILWFLSSYGPSGKMHQAFQTYELALQQPGADTTLIEEEYKTEKLASSYAGIMGKAIEPAIRPIGYDWKIGIALITSFAAREVFVGTMATLYSVEDDGGDNMALREKMEAATFSDGSKVFTLATGVSLMVFYVFAMQCMSTLAIVKRETGTWKWPIIQVVYMTALAYIMSLLFYTIFK